MSNFTDFLVIGDIHIRIDCLLEYDIFSSKLIEKAKELSPKYIVILGDILHSHERLHTICLNKACELIDNLRKISFVYVLVGNHDMISCNQFMSKNHWLNPLKEWNNIKIVDVTEYLETDEGKFIFVPYVPNSKFEEALNYNDIEWKDAKIIFSHQEFYGCKMGSIVSTDGDKWNENYPEIISGHIHSKQYLQNNIFYIGSSMQIAFGESENNIIGYVKQYPENKYILEEIELDIIKKKIVYVDSKKFDDLKLEKKNTDNIKITIQGTNEEFKSIKKSKKYKELQNQGFKIVFKDKKVDNIAISQEINCNDIKKVGESNFEKILFELVNKENNNILIEDYNYIINDKKTD